MSATDTLRIEVETLSNRAEPSCVATRARITSSVEGLDFSSSPTVLQHAYGVTRRVAMLRHADQLAAAHAKLAGWTVAHVTPIPVRAGADGRGSMSVWIGVEGE